MAQVLFLAGPKKELSSCLARSNGVKSPDIFASGGNIKRLLLHFQTGMTQL